MLNQRFCCRVPCGWPHNWQEFRVFQARVVYGLQQLPGMSGTTEQVGKQLGGSDMLMFSAMRPPCFFTAVVDFNMIFLQVCAKIQEHPVYSTSLNQQPDLARPNRHV